jgi:predicted GIY-YIG superfamily endonuclease
MMPVKRKAWTIYVITCRTTGKQYIGQTTAHLAVRWGQHIGFAHYPSQATNRNYLTEAILKFSPEDFIVEAVACALSSEDADHVEAHLISTFNTIFPAGLNTRAGGTHGRYKMNPLAAKKRADQLAKCRRDPEINARRSRNSGLARRKHFGHITDQRQNTLLG